MKAFIFDRYAIWQALHKLAIIATIALFLGMAICAYGESFVYDIEGPIPPNIDFPSSSDTDIANRP